MGRWIVVFFLPFVLLAEDLDQKVEATVQGYPITTLDVKKRLALSSEQRIELSEIFLSPKGRAVWKQTLEALIEEKALLYLATQEGVRLEEEEKKQVYFRLRQVAKQFGSLANLSLELKKRGLSLKDLEKVFATQLLIRKFLSKRFRERFEVRPWEIQRFYDRVEKAWKTGKEIPKEWRPLFTPSSLLLQQVYFNSPERAREVFEKLQKKEITFLEAVKRYSQGPRKRASGIWKLESEKDLADPAMRRKVKKAKLRKIYLIHLEGHSVIFRVLKREKARLLPFSDVQDKITRLLLEKKYRRLVHSLKKRIVKQLDIRRFGEE